MTAAVWQRGNVTLYVDGQKVGEGRVAATQPLLFSADETCDVGSDRATPLSDDYGLKDSTFNGRVRWVWTAYMSTPEVIALCQPGDECRKRSISSCV